MPIQSTLFDAANLQQILQGGAPLEAYLKQHEQEKLLDQKIKGDLEEQRIRSEGLLALQSGELASKARLQGSELAAKAREGEMNRKNELDKVSLATRTQFDKLGEAEQLRLIRELAEQGVAIDPKIENLGDRYLDGVEKAKKVGLARVKDLMSQQQTAEDTITRIETKAAESRAAEAAGVAKEALAVGSAAPYPIGSEDDRKAVASFKAHNAGKKVSDLEAINGAVLKPGVRAAMLESYHETIRKAENQIRERDETKPSSELRKAYETRTAATKTKDAFINTVLGRHGYNAYLNGADALKSEVYGKTEEQMKYPPRDYAAIKDVPPLPAGQTETGSGSGGGGGGGVVPVSPLLRGPTTAPTPAPAPAPARPMLEGMEGAVPDLLRANNAAGLAIAGTGVGAAQYYNDNISQPLWDLLPSSGEMRPIGTALGESAGQVQEGVDTARRALVRYPGERPPPDMMTAYTGAIRGGVQAVANPVRAGLQTAFDTVGAPIDGAFSYIRPGADSTAALPLPKAQMQQRIVKLFGPDAVALLAPGGPVEKLAHSRGMADEERAAVFNKALGGDPESVAGIRRVLDMVRSLASAKPITPTAQGYYDDSALLPLGPENAPAVEKPYQFLGGDPGRYDNTGTPRR